MREEIESNFDNFSQKVTNYEALNKAVNYFKENREDLLKVWFSYTFRDPLNPIKQQSKQKT